MPKHGMDTAGIRRQHGKNTDFTHKKWSIGYDTTRYVAHFEVSMHHRSCKPQNDFAWTIYLIALDQIEEGQRTEFNRGLIHKPLI